MALSLPPDPYLALGVSKDAHLAEIRSAHRKLVLKCHPDKVQDAALKAIKQDEFQKVQQAYELLSDENRRLQYDEQVKLLELRKEMRRGVPTMKPDPFEFEIRVAEPRTSYATRSRGSPPVKIYTTHSPPKTYDSPKMYEDVYEKPLRSAKKSTSYESADRKRDDEKLRDAREREIRKREDEKKRAAHGDRKKSRDKDKRRDVEEKRTRTTPYFENGSDDSDPPLSREVPREVPRERRTPRDRPRMEEIPVRTEVRTSASPRIGTAPLTPKWDGHKDSAFEYINAARSKAPDDGFRAPTLRRGETFAGSETVYTVRYAEPTKATFSLSDEEDNPRRSSFRRRASETPSRSREPPRKESSSKRSPSTRKAYADIVEPPSPPPMPKLKTHTSAPPTSEFSTPLRAKTEYPRKSSKDGPIPHITRSQTFQSGDRERGRDREGSKLRIPVQYDSPESDSDGPIYAAPRTSRSPPRPARTSRSPPRPQRTSSPPRRRDAPETTRYSVSSQGGTVPMPPMPRHRSELHNIDTDSYFSRERSESPRGGKSSGSRQAQRSQAHHTPTEPIVLTARPKASRDHGTSGSSRSHLYGEVEYSRNYRAEDIRYSPQASVDPFRRGSDLGPRDNYPSPRSGRGEVYASG